MDTEIEIISGRNNHLVDPHLAIWGWELPAYFFLGGLGAGLLVLVGLLVLAGKEERYPTVTGYATLVVPPAMGIGVGLLLLDLHHVWYSWRLFLTFQPTSPISWGTWLLTVAIVLAMVFAFVQLPRTVFLNWVRIPLLLPIHEKLQPLKRPLALVLVLCGAGVGIYTGVLLSTMQARPFWNSNVMGALFLTSGLTAGTATAMLLARLDREKKMLATVLTGTITVELMLLFLFVLGHATGGAMGQEVVQMLLGGEMTMHFLVFDIALGLLAPLALLVAQLGGWARYTPFAPLLAMFGGLMLRFTMVEGGLLTKWLPY
jgi:formate-dependent nitrite reductase membrane component NrfD